MADLLQSRGKRRVDPAEGVLVDGAGEPVRSRARRASRRRSRSGTSAGRWSGWRRRGRRWPGAGWRRRRRCPSRATAPPKRAAASSAVVSWTRRRRRGPRGTPGPPRWARSRTSPRSGRCARGSEGRGMGLSGSGCGAEATPGPRSASMRACPHGTPICAPNGGCGRPAAGWSWGSTRWARARLCAPVVAAAVLVRPNTRKIAGVRDSKTLSLRQREALVAEIQRRSLAWGVGAASVAEIERLNIYHASHLAMRRALRRVGPYDHVLVDGRADRGLRRSSSGHAPPSSTVMRPHTPSPAPRSWPRSPATG